MEMVQSAASEIERATEWGSRHAVVAQASRRRASSSTPPASDSAISCGWVRSGLPVVIAEVAMVFFLTFFLLLSGDTYKRKLVRLDRPLAVGQKAHRAYPR
jgi:predicted PurR-regulated permease PerM